jgi:hypothetical protein
MLRNTWPLLVGKRALLASTWRGAFLKKNASQSVTTTLAGLTWQTELADTDSFHDNVNTTRCTIPSGVSLVRLVTNIYASGTTGNTLLRHMKNNSTFRGMGQGDSAGGSGTRVNIATCPMAVSAADWFETQMSINAGSFGMSTEDETWTQLEVLDPATKYALVYNTAGQAHAANTTTALACDGEVVDTNGFHDTVTNNSRLTVPSGVTLVRLTGNQFGASVTGQNYSQISKNGATARGLPARDTDTGDIDCNNLFSAPIEVTAGDYFEFTGFYATANTVPTSAANWFAIEEVPATYKRVLVYKSAVQACGTFSTNTVSFNSEVYKTDAAMHDTVTNNSRLVVPAGCTKARPIFNLRSSNTTDVKTCWVWKNGGGYAGMPGDGVDTTGTDNQNAVGAWVDVVPGDYFTLHFYTNTACDIDNGNETWFCLECQ